MAKVNHLMKLTLRLYNDYKMDPTFGEIINAVKKVYDCEKVNYIRFTIICRFSFLLLMKLQMKLLQRIKKRTMKAPINFQL